MHVDTVINARWIIPIVPKNCLLENHSLVVDEGIIIDILPTEQAGKYQAKKTHYLTDHLITAGFINAHTHAAMNLLRGIADDLPLHEWLEEHIWPAEAEMATADFVHDGTLLAIAEMLRGGTTCFNDMYFFPDQIALAVKQVGIRATIGLPVIDFPTRWASNIDEYLTKALAVRDQYQGDPLISFSFAPHAPYTVSDSSFARCQPIFDELGICTHMHVHETSQEIEDSHKAHDTRPLNRLKDLQLLGPNFIAVHMTELNDEEIELLTTYGVHVVHCPESNLKLASGFCPVDKLIKAGVNVALGTDGAASNNDLDMIGEMKTAALLAKGINAKADTLPAHTVLEMATINGAKALGLDDKTGSIEIGKQADIIAINLNQLETQPVYDPVSTLIYSASRSQVTDVWVNGTQQLKGGQLTQMNIKELINKATDWQQKLAHFHHKQCKIDA